MKLLTKQQQESYKIVEIYYICQGNLYDNYVTDKKAVKLEINVITQGNTEVLRIAYVI